MWKNRWLAEVKKKNKMFLALSTSICVLSKKKVELQFVHFFAALAKFGDCVSSEKAMFVDERFTDYPEKVEYHWIISEVIPINGRFFFDQEGKWKTLKNVFDLKFCSKGKI